ncbi:MAG: phosphoribosylformylglycinamidine synthase [Anaerostipes sp.]|nr:phosphoribosylformylglycinamidine synthase [Anaerostipes sp.]MDD3747558.1 phosphoribosylformylglycinamidine synthase [Anaerostipes sp.]
MAEVKRVYVEKKKDYAIKAKELLEEVKQYLGLDVKAIRVLIRYDVENVSDDVYQKAVETVFSEPPVDDVYEETFEMGDKDHCFSVEYLPGQFDQRADSAQQCVKLLDESEDPIIRSATTYVIEGELTEEQLDAVKDYCINPVDSREADAAKPETLVMEFEEPEDVKTFDGFAQMNEDEFKKLYDSLNLAMTFKDFLHIQNYFKEEEKRNPSMTEIRVLDTYWSDHCRHTTFSTELKNIEFGEGYFRTPIEAAYDQYMMDRQSIFRGRKDKFVCLMDLALMAMRRLKKDGVLDNMEETDEINACSIVVPVSIDGKEEEEWLISFKNETHNHPTEIEPFGGAATCLGGAIRDPLSGRSYVYQAMRVTGASDPTVPLNETLKGKLPQRKIVTGAAHGYSSYGNQIGLATGFVDEIYHPDYVAKRMEIGAVMGAAPRSNVVRESSDPGDIIILLGGRTGRDGCGGATGSSKVHTEESIETCGAEVQKGNAPTERKIQRLFRRPEVSRLIKKCNDFGAGGVSVAIGELADGLTIDLDKVPKKYAGLDGTELAISESQERMAVVIDPKDVDQFLAYSEEENLEAVSVAVVTEDPRLVLSWRGKEIVNLSRAFLDTNGAHQENDVKVEIPSRTENFFAQPQETDFKKACYKALSDLNNCSKKGLVEMFDSSIGAGSVTMPFGGKNQLTPIQTMIAKLPVLKGKSDTVTMMSYGYDPYLSEWSPFHGSVYAIAHSIAKIVASGGDYRNIRLTFQEYFKRLGEDKTRWGQPFASLLGAYHAQLGFGLASIGGKDSMSGTFNDIDVPPTLVSFAVDVADAKNVVTPELKKAGNRLLRVCIPKDAYELPNYAETKRIYRMIHKLIKKGAIKSAYAIGAGGTIEAVAKMAFGNGLGVDFDQEVILSDLTENHYGSFVIEMNTRDIKYLETPSLLLGEITKRPELSLGDEVVALDEAIAVWEKPLEEVYPTKSYDNKEELETKVYSKGSVYIAKNKVAVPNVFIPVFPGTNCEYDSARAFEAAGANVITKVFKNLDAQGIRDSVDEFQKAIDQSQIIMFPGGFSAGDEPEGSAKFFATAFRNEKLKESVMNLLDNRDGLALGICNGFQALIKLGLVPEGKIINQTADAPTLTMNSIGRHISKVAYTRVTSNLSPWFNNVSAGDVFSIPVSHGEGRFVASDEVIENLIANGQIATQYVNLDGNPTMDEEFNPNGSYCAIEGITSPDGRVLGKMGHSERIGEYVAMNIKGNSDQKIFLSGVEYFK